MCVASAAASENEVKIAWVNCIDKALWRETMKRYLFIVIWPLLAGCARKSDPRLSGTFISDKAATMEYLLKIAGNDPKKITAYRRLGKYFGRMKITYNGSCATTEFDGFVDTERIKIIESTDTYIILESKLLGEAVQHKLEFCDDGYWVSGGVLGAPFKEKFKKIK